MENIFDTMRPIPLGPSRTAKLHKYVMDLVGCSWSLGVADNVDGGTFHASLS